MYAVILAGGKLNPGDELWTESKGLSKALIDIQGKPMIQWVIDAADKSESVDRLIVAGLSEKGNLKSEKPAIFLADQGGIFENLSESAKIILQEAPGTVYFLCISADIPLISAEIIEDVIAENQSPGIDFFYNIVKKTEMQTTFPGVKRTYMKFKDGSFCGADIHIFSTQIVDRLQTLEIAQYRKKPFKLISLVGAGSIIRMIFYPPDIEEAAKIVTRHFGFYGKPVVSKYPEIAMDVDTLQHLSVVREKLAQKNQSENKSKYNSVVNTEKPGLVFRFLNTFQHTGDSILLFPLVLLLFFFSEGQIRERAGVFFAGMLLTGLVVMGLKYTVRKKRPEGNAGKMYRKYDPFSFPSGHTARAWTIVVIALFFNWFFATVLTIWALLITFSRLKLKLHDVTDVSAGTIIGIITGFFTIWLSVKFEFL